jgi:hypothetical protein
MVPELDPEIIHNFRNKVHDYNDFTRIFFVDYKASNNIDGKDIWSKICSCMDWLTVSVEGIEKPEKDPKNMNIASLKFTHFLVTIDMIVEAVNHLWLAIGQVNKVKQPYLKDRSVFMGREFDRNYTDEEYFKEIRSWFGVHAVNGNVVELKGYEKGVRFFSSWSSSNRFFNEDEYYVKLYSNNSKAEEKYGGIKKVTVEQLMNFVVMRYNTLPLLMGEIDKLYSKEKKRLQNTSIQFNRHTSERNQLIQLQQQAKERKLTEEWYEYEIDKYITFLSCDLGEFEELERKLIEEFLLDLKVIIPVYRKIIQEVDDSEYEEFELLRMGSRTFADNRYDFSKVLDMTNGGNYSPGMFSLETLIEKGVLPSYSLYLSAPALRLLIHALDHKWSK